jgi:hypothetical protein
MRRGVKLFAVSSPLNEIQATIKRSQFIVKSVKEYHIIMLPNYFLVASITGASLPKIG